MKIGFSVQNLNLYTRSATLGLSDRNAPVYAVPADSQREQSRFTMQRVDALNKAFSKIDRILRSPRAPVRSLEAEVTSTASLGLDNSRTMARLESTDQVNATPTSFTPFGPTIDGASTADVTIKGVYNGENGDDTLRFVVNRGGTHGEDNLRIKVYNGAGDRIKTINIRDFHNANENYNIGNGLKLNLGAGDLVKNDEFYVDVSASAGSAVDPDKAFNGTRNDQPNFEYGTSVTAGSFDVNGTSIAVYANDTINTVLSRIDTSAAGVTASFDPASERITLTQEQAGSDAEIVVENDTSGFLAATKLSGAFVTPGKDADIDRLLGDVDQLDDVRNGTLTVNGTQITIDTSLDTLNDIIARINAEAAGISAQLIEDGQRVHLKSTEPGEEIVLDDPDTGFLLAVGIEPGQYGAEPGNSGFSPTRATSLANAVQRAVGAINDLSNDARIPGTAGPELASLRSALQVAAGSSGAGADGASDNGYVGLSFAPDNFGGDVRNSASLDRQRLRRLAIEQPEQVEQYFLGSQGNGGLLKRLANALSGYMQGHADHFGSVGSLLDVFI